MSQNLYQVFLFFFNMNNESFVKILCTFAILFHWIVSSVFCKPLGFLFA